MRIVFANSGGFGPPKPHFRALASVSPKPHVLVSYFYVVKWDAEWFSQYVVSGKP